MKKLFIFPIVAVVFLVYFYLTRSDSISEKRVYLKVEQNLVLPIGDGSAPFQSKKFATKKLKHLTIANEQCNERGLDFSNQVQNIHQVLIQALEFELKQGKSERELLAYSNQYKTFYDSYDDLLRQAQINIEKVKYNYTSSVDILYDWNGLSVIDGFSSQQIPKIVQRLKKFEDKSNRISIELKLDDNISKSDVYDLLDNSENFNTYLESPFEISSSSVISPSILFVLTATQLTIDEFEQAISMQSFTVNDVAVAIMNEMPFEYLELLITQTKSIEDLPIIIQEHYDSYKNVADIAASKHNVKLLKLLEGYGVKASDEAGIITAMDIAIVNLPHKAESYKNLESFPDKYLDTLSYLNRKGYKAHGKTYQNESETFVKFKVPNGRGYSSYEVLASNLRDYLFKIELIDGSSNIHQLSPDDSLVSKAIETIKIKKTVLDDKSESCKSIRKELLSEEGFADSGDAYDLIYEIEQNKEYIPERLHEIDPVLVNLWRESNENRSKQSKNSSHFIAFLKEKNYQQALDYSASTPLTARETDVLLMSLIRNIEDIAPIWNARVSPLSPSTLFAFKFLDDDKWELLMNVGFDFSIKDKSGNDIFSASVIDYPKAIKFLLDNGFKPEVEGLGMDALDILLEETYEKGRLNPNLGKIVNAIKSFEPSHYSRVARIKKFFPDEYEKLIKINKKLEPIGEVQINRFRMPTY